VDPTTRERGGRQLRRLRPDLRVLGVLPGLTHRLQLTTTMFLFQDVAACTTTIILASQLPTMATTTYLNIWATFNATRSCTAETADRCHSPPMPSIHTTGTKLSTTSLLEENIATPTKMRIATRSTSLC
jgi:phage shock protein PspC (stress-responsive transcriptional regulator)